MQAVANTMGVTQRQIETCYGQLDQALAANNFDFVLIGWEIAGEPQANTTVLRPVFIVMEEDCHAIRRPTLQSIYATSELSLSVLYGKTVGTGDGYRAATILQAFPQITTKLYVGDLPFDDLKQKKLNAIFLDFPMLHITYWAQVQAGPDPCLKPLGKTMYQDVYVTGFNKSNPNARTVLNELNQAIARLKKDGTLKKIYITWKMWNDQQAQLVLCRSIIS